MEQIRQNNVQELVNIWERASRTLTEAEEMDRNEWGADAQGAYAECIDRLQSILDDDFQRMCEAFFDRCTVGKKPKDCTDVIWQAVKDIIWGEVVEILLDNDAHISSAENAMRRLIRVAYSALSQPVRIVQDSKEQVTI